MRRQRRFVQGLSLAIAAALVCGCVAKSPLPPASTTGSSPRSRTFTRAPAGNAHGHLYAFGYFRRYEIVRFPLRRDGLPATQPDGILYPQGLTNSVAGLGVDGIGNVYLIDGIAQRVVEYAAGGTGPQSPIATLNLVGHYPDNVRADEAGHLFVHYSATDSFGIYAPGAQGNDHPISTIPAYRYLAALQDYSIARSGTLYALYYGPIAVYSNPLSSPRQPDALLYPQGGYEFDFGPSLAFDRATDRLYVQFVPRASGGYHNLDFAARNPDNPGAKHTDRWLLNNLCYQQMFSWVGGAVITGKYYLDVSCGLSGTDLVFRALDFHKQQPLETIGQGLGLYGPIAVGP